VIARLGAFFAPARARTWWEYKTPVFLGVAYLSASLAQTPLSQAWPAFVACVLAIIPLASFVCVINDITDERDDRNADKNNTMQGKTPAFKAGWIVGCLLAGAIVFVLFFRGNVAAALLYAINWLAFVFYSVPPFRLKVRGAAGVLADALGGTMLPALWCALLVDPYASTPFIATMAVWGFAFGLRGILYHQAGDIAADERAGVRTFAARLGLARLRLLVRSFVFPVELLALAALLWTGRSIFLAPLAATYLFTQVLLWNLRGIVSVAVVPRTHCRFVLMKYYQFWLPITFILALSSADLSFLLLLPLQLALFPDCWIRIGYHVRQILAGQREVI